MDKNKLKQVLTDAKKYIIQAHDNAECKHDDMGGENYNDFGLYEIMEETNTLVKDIDVFLMNI